MGTFNFSINYLTILKKISRYPEGLSTSELFSNIPKINFKISRKTYHILEKLRDAKYIISYRTKTLPTYSNHKITEKGINLIEEFDKIYYPKEKPIEKTIEEPKTITKTIVEYKEPKKLEPDELAKLIQSVVYSLLEVLGKEYEEISKKKAIKLQTIAEKIVNKIRGY